MAERSVEDLAEELRAAIGSFVRRTREAAGTPSDARSETLGMLDRAGPQTAAMLARQRSVTHQSMRATLAEMEAEGLVVSAPDPADRRGKLFRLAPAGRAALAGLREARVAWLAAKLDTALDAGERRVMAQAVALLNRLSTD